MTSAADADNTSPNAWRSVIATLANDDARRTYAHLVLDGSLHSPAGWSPARRRRALDALLAAGLVEQTPDGVHTSATVFRDILSAAQPTASPRTGVGRFVRPDGRIDRYPANAVERTALLAHVAEQAFPDDVEHTEKQVNDRLAVYADDVALLRRYLVDEGLLRRNASGSRYARAERLPG
ncbi:DUF2087 domain-containing protein [uncultured Microbacterium sp.]|uniref:DUF2087 domain-containing protein n=1 Tax=uncultured Microbacterium sp. TaxID=191216 RepID=UPI0035CAB806